MSEQGRFGEPWSTTDQEVDACRIYESGSRGIADKLIVSFGAGSNDGDAEARSWRLARRIVDCVNTLAGIPDPAAWVKEKDAGIKRLREALYNLYMAAMQSDRYSKDQAFREVVDRAIEVYPYEDGLRAALKPEGEA